MPIEPCRLDQAHNGGRALAPAQRAREQPVRTPDRPGADLVLHPIVVDRRIAVVKVARQRLPALEAVDSLRAVLYDFAPSRAGEHCRTFLEDWRGKLVTDDYAGYKAGFAAGITELGCMAHARRKFHDLHANNQSQIAAKALELFGALYSVEQDVAELPAEERRQIRLERAKPITETLHRWQPAA